MQEYHPYNEQARRVWERPGPYRSRRRMFLGVCRGLALHFNLSATGVRIVFVVVALFTGLGPVILGYLLAGLLMREEPILPLDSDVDAEFYNSYMASRSMALQRLQRTHDQLERRIQRIESTVTSRGYDWERRLNK